MSNASQSPTKGWTEARLARLVELWTARLSAAQIARQLGDGLTRSAVVGKLFRMGLTQNAAERAAARAQGARDSRRKQRRSRPKTFRPPPEPFPLGPPCRTAPLMTDLVELTPSSCRWPYPSEAGTRFCGHETAGGGPYCLDHRERAYAGSLPPLTMEQIENIIRRAS